MGIVLGLNVLGIVEMLLVWVLGFGGRRLESFGFVVLLGLGGFRCRGVCGGCEIFNFGVVVCVVGCVVGVRFGLGCSGVCGLLFL